jgi:hypothetical protein
MVREIPYGNGEVCRDPVDYDRIEERVTRYLEGESINAIARSQRVDRSTVKDTLIRRGAWDPGRKPAGSADLRTPKPPRVVQSTTELAMTVACAQCGARPDEPCRLARGTRNGRPASRKTCHAQRHQAATKAAPAGRGLS